MTPLNVLDARGSHTINNKDHSSVAKRCCMAVNFLRVLKSCVLVLGCSATATLWAEGCPSGAPIDQCLTERLEIENQNLAKYYERLLNRLKGQSGEVVRASQLFWNQYRDNTCEFEKLYHATIQPGLEASGREAVNMRCLIRMTRLRADELKTYNSSNLPLPVAQVPEPLPSAPTELDDFTDFMTLVANLPKVNDSQRQGTAIRLVDWLANKVNVLNTNYGKTLYRTPLSAEGLTMAKLNKCDNINNAICVTTKKLAKNVSNSIVFFIGKGALKNAQGSLGVATQRISIDKGSENFLVAKDRVVLSNDSDSQALTPGQARTKYSRNAIVYAARGGVVVDPLSSITCVNTSDNSISQGRCVENVTVKGFSL